MPKLVAMLRVKDGALFIQEWLARMNELVDEIVVIDNGSTDGTLEVLRRHPKVVSVDCTQGFDEGRDKNLAYQRVRERRADWVIWLDVDEIFEDAVSREQLEKLMKSRAFTRVFFRRFHMIDSSRFNMDWFFFQQTGWPSRVMWQDQETGYFENTRFNNGLIKGIQGLPAISHLRIKHLGYVNASNVKQKAQLYLSIDPRLEDIYRKMEMKNPVIWRWHEYSDAPLAVTAQNLVMDIYLVGADVPVVLSRAGKWIANLFSLVKRHTARVE